MLLLDEPTNNLDIHSIGWLERVINESNATMIIISHDRHFLNQVCTHMADLDYGTIKVYGGNYDDFMLASTQAQALISAANAKAIVRPPKTPPATHSPHPPPGPRHRHPARPQCQRRPGVLRLFDALGRPGHSAQGHEMDAATPCAAVDQPPQMIVGGALGQQPARLFGQHFLFVGKVEMQITPSWF